MDKENILKEKNGADALILCRSASQNYSPLVSIVILNWNGLKDTIECLESLEKIDYSNYKIIVVDNNSEGNDAGILEKKYRNYKYNKNYINVIRSKKNLGFGGGNNMGIRTILEEGKSKYILLLNNDTVVEPNFLKELVKTAENNSRLGIVGGKILYYNKPNKIWYAGGKLDLLRGSGYHFFQGKINQSEISGEIDVTFITGCLMLIKKELFKKIGLLPEEYFLSVEDVDFCYNVISQGYKLKVNLNSKIYHKVSVSKGGENSVIDDYYVTRNRIYFMLRKIKNKKYLIPFMVFFLFSRIIIFFKFLIKGKGKKIWMMFRGIKDGLTGNLKIYENRN